MYDTSDMIEELVAAGCSQQIAVAIAKVTQKGNAAMNANLVTEDKLTTAVAQINSAIAAQSADIRALTATMEAGFREIRTKFDEQGTQITSVANLSAANLNTAVEKLNANMARLETKMVFMGLVTFGGATILTGLLKDVGGWIGAIFHK